MSSPFSWSYTTVAPLFLTVELRCAATSQQEDEGELQLCSSRVGKRRSSLRCSNTRKKNKTRRRRCRRLLRYIALRCNAAQKKKKKKVTTSLLSSPSSLCCTTKNTKKKKKVTALLPSPSLWSWSAAPQQEEETRKERSKKVRCLHGSRSCSRVGLAPASMALLLQAPAPSSFLLNISGALAME